MPRRNFRKESVGTTTPSTFWSMKDNPKGASVGNAVNPIIRGVNAIRSVVSQGAFKPVQKVSEPAPMTIQKSQAILQPKSRLSGGRRILMK